MPARVVDASAAAALIFVEPQADEVARQLEGFDLLAPGLLAYELASVARKKAVLHPELAGQILGALGRLGDLGVTLVDVDPVEVVQLALASGLSTYDASYLVLSRSAGTSLVTLDQRLRAAARRSK